MKSLLLSLSFVVAGVAAMAQAPKATVKWYTLEQAIELSKQNPKKIMIDVYTDWCGWCKKMDSETFSNPVIAKYLTDHFYPVKFNAEQKGNVVFQGKTFKYVDQGGGRGYHELAAALLKNQLSFPSIAYLNEKLEFLGAIPGYRDAKQFEPLINYISDDKYLNTAFDVYEKSFVGQVK
jgi:thioredoxin-related protein